MEISQIIQKAKTIFSKYKFVVIILLVGIGLMLLPSNGKRESSTTKQETQQIEASLEESLSRILCKMHGAGKVEVMLNIGQGEKTIYQVDNDISENDSGYADRKETVTLTDGQRNQYGLVQQVNPPVYLGAVVLCQGANDPVVKLSIVEAVSKVTGLSANQICVLKMD